MTAISAENALQRDQTLQQTGRQMGQQTRAPVDLFVIGGGINGCGIARDAAGRGLSVTLAEMGDLASATSSSSTKLLHGGLRYLEFFEFRLVREALQERETLLRAMPHIAWPLRFVLPYHKSMRFAGGTPTARLLGAVMPWMRGRRPAWLIRLGLFLYDHLGGRGILPGTAALDLAQDPAGVPLQPRFKHAFEYSDCWVEDSRLVVLNARDAKARGAAILTRTSVTSARREGNLWRVTITDAQGQRDIMARALVNAAGPWVADILAERIGLNVPDTVRLVRGSHIVVPKLYQHDRAYFLQGEDGRIIFAIPYEHEFTLIGTTDADHPDPDQPPECTPAEISYLCNFASQYFKQAVHAADIVWTYSGVRPLHDDGQSSATATSRDYVVRVEHSGPAPLLNVFGGKITTYRRLAESALADLAEFFPHAKGPWTARAPLPGGDFPIDGVAALIEDLQAAHPFLTPAWAQRLIRAYGTDARAVLAGAESAADLGRDFGATLTEAELRWMMTHEFAQTGEDAVWRRTRLGLKLSAAQIATVDEWMQANAP